MTEVEDCCLSYAGDSYDWYIKTITGHHPACSNFKKVVRNVEEFPSYGYKVNFCNILHFLQTKTFVKKENLVEVAFEIMNVLEISDGREVYRENHIRN